MDSGRHTDYDRYWRYEHPDSSKDRIAKQLRAQGRRVIASDRNRVLSEAIRADRGDMVYENHIVEDLRRFIQQRRLQLPKNRNSQRRLIEVLKSDDDNKVFGKFLELPPELRERVYGFYIAAFPRFLKFPTQPPLARTCRLMKREVLPVFYKQATFELVLVKKRRLNSNHYYSFTGKLAFSSETTSWLRSQPAESDGCMRKIFLNSWVGNSGLDDSTVLIELNSQGTHFTLQEKTRNSFITLPSNHGSGFYTRALKAICGSEGKHGIGMNEVYLLRKEAEAVLQAVDNGSL